VARCATPPARIRELLAILTAQHERLRTGVIRMIQKGSWTMRDHNGWINHSMVSGDDAGNVALTISDGHDLIILQASDISLRDAENAFGPECRNMAPFTAFSEDDARSRMIETLSLFETLVLERESTRRIRTDTPDGLNLLTRVETRLKAVGIALSPECDPDWPEIALQAPCPWRGMEAVGTIRGRPARIMGANQAERLSEGIPPIADMTISTPARADPRHATRTRSWRVDVEPVSIGWRDEVESVVERMRLLASLPTMDGNA
jgi:hypothetical protein